MANDLNCTYKALIIFYLTSTIFNNFNSSVIIFGSSHLAGSGCEEKVIYLDQYLVCKSFSVRVPKNTEDDFKSSARIF